LNVSSTKPAVNRPAGQPVEQDDKSYTLTFDVPGISKRTADHRHRRQRRAHRDRAGRPRKYKAAYELPTGQADQHH
jgi:HSP20 family molecular chaperone IbpA